MQNLLHPTTAHSRKTLLIPVLAIAAIVALATLPADAQLNLSAPQSAPTPQPASSYQGSVATDKPSADTLQLTLEEAVQRGLKTNLGLLLSNTQVANSRGFNSHWALAVNNRLPSALKAT